MKIRKKTERHAAAVASTNTVWEQFAAHTTYEIKEAQGNFTGLASVYGSIAQGARGPTRFSRGAFRETLAESGGKVPLLWQHDQAKPVGVISALSEGRDGLELQGKITLNTFGQDVLALMRDGALSGLSIGFDAIEAAPEAHSEFGKVRVVSKAKLHEVSLVTFPADAHARVMTVHSFSPADLTEYLSKSWTDAQRERFAVLVESMDLERHAGRMFSELNLKKMREAWTMLTDLLGRGDVPFLKEAVAAIAAVEARPVVPEYPTGPATTEPAAPPAEVVPSAVETVAVPEPMKAEKVMEILTAIKMAEIDLLERGLSL